MFLYGNVHRYYSFTDKELWNKQYVVKIIIIETISILCNLQLLLFFCYGILYFIFYPHLRFTHGAYYIICSLLIMMSVSALTYKNTWKFEFKYEWGILWLYIILGLAYIFNNPFHNLIISLKPLLHTFCNHN